MRSMAAMNALTTFRADRERAKQERALAAQSREERAVNLFPAITSKGTPASRYFTAASRSTFFRRPANKSPAPSVPGASWLRKRILAQVPSPSFVIARRAHKK